MKNVQLIESVVGRWHPSDIAFIESLICESELRSPGTTVTLKCILIRRDQSTNGWPSPQTPCFQVVLRFDNVSQMTIKGFGGRAIQITGFAIDDISDRGWEAIRYEIYDFEQEERIRFYCSNIEVLDARACDPKSFHASSMFDE